MASNKRQFPRFHAAQGLTLLELLLAIGVVTVLIVVGVILFGNTRDEQREVDLITKVHSLQAVIKQLYHEPKYSTITGPLLSNASSLARSMADAGGNLISPWGTPIDVGPATYAGSTGATYQLTFNTTPQNHCVALVRDALIQPVLKVTVGSTVLKDMSASPAISINDLQSTLDACSVPTTIELISS